MASPHPSLPGISSPTPPGDNAEEIRRQAALLHRTHPLRALYDAVNEMILVLNRKRQILFMNQACLDFLNQTDPQQFYGLRYGETMGCQHAAETPSGCGSSPACPSCGALQAITASQRGPVQQEFRLTCDDPTRTGEFQVRTTRLEMEGEPFTILALRDIRHEKRRNVLERIFFHDILNTAAGVKGLAEVFQMVDAERQKLFSNKIKLGAGRLVDEINSHRILAAAERNELHCSFSEINTLEFLQEMLPLYENEALARSQRLFILEEAEAFTLHTDTGLLSRVLGNMIKNALEANPTEEMILLDCHLHENRIRFTVQNQGVIPPEVQTQIFTRSFSTKGEGRGLGTWAMKLLGENYLGGTLSFDSDPDQGITRFHADFPLFPGT